MVSKAFVDESGIKSSEKITNRNRPKSSSNDVNLNSKRDSTDTAELLTIEPEPLNDIPANNGKSADGNNALNGTGNNGVQNSIQNVNGVQTFPIPTIVYPRNGDIVKSQPQPPPQQAVQSSKVDALRSLYHSSKKAYYQQPQAPPQQQPQPQAPPQQTFKNHYIPNANNSNVNAQYNPNPPSTNVGSAQAPHAQQYFYDQTQQNPPPPNKYIQPRVNVQARAHQHPQQHLHPQQHPQNHQHVATKGISNAHISAHVQPRSQPQQKQQQQSTKHRNRPVYTQEIRANDVIHGKTIFGQHAGNDFYRAVLKKYYRKYINTKNPTEQKKIGLLIYYEIINQTPQGRFMRYSESSKAWTEMGKKDSFEYVMHVLKDCETREMTRRKRSREKEEEKNRRREKRRLEARAQASKGNVNEEVIPIDIEETEDYGEAQGTTAGVSGSNPPQAAESIPKVGDNSAVAQFTQIEPAGGPAKVAHQADAGNVQTSHGTKVGDKSAVAHNVKTCEHCLGTGAISLTKAISSELKSQRTPQNSSTGSARVVSANEADTSHAENGENRTGTEMTAWEAHIRILEEQLGISTNPDLDYPERILEIEKRSREKEKKENREKELPLNLLDDENMVEMLEKAEKKWGVEVPEGYNYAQRIELIEKTAFGFMARLQVWT